MKFFILHYVNLKIAGLVNDEGLLDVYMSKIEQTATEIRSEISDADLDNVVGGNDDPKMKKKNEGTPWVCPGCGATIIIRQFQDGPKHMTKCPGNPYK